MERTPSNCAKTGRKCRTPVVSVSHLTVSGNMVYADGTANADGNNTVSNQVNGQNFYDRTSLDIQYASDVGGNPLPSFFIGLRRNDIQPCPDATLVYIHQKPYWLDIVKDLIYVVAKASTTANACQQCRAQYENDTQTR